MGTGRTDDLDNLINQLAVEDPGLPGRIDTAVERRVLARQLAARRLAAGLSQTDVAQRMGSSQSQIARFEAGADIRMSTVARYAAAIGTTITWHIDTAPHTAA